MVNGGPRHGMSHTLTYQVWRGMIARCTYPNNPRFPHYGARGIRVCERWLKSFAAFYEDMGEKPPEMSIDRIDNDGNYEPSNCRWASRTAQQRNRSNCRLITIAGETKALSEWCQIYGRKSPTVIKRLKRGMAPVEALSTSETSCKQPFSHRNSVITEVVGFKYFLVAIGLSLFLAGAAPAATSSLRHTRRMTRITVLKPVRAQGRARAGYPFLQSTANVTRIGVNLSGLINPIGWFF